MDAGAYSIFRKLRNVVTFMNAGFWSKQVTFSINFFENIKKLLNNTKEH